MHEPVYRSLPTSSLQRLMFFEDLFHLAMVGPFGRGRFRSKPHSLLSDVLANPCESDAGWFPRRAPFGVVPFEPCVELVPGEAIKAFEACADPVPGKAVNPSNPAMTVSLSDPAMTLSLAKQSGQPCG